MSVEEGKGRKVRAAIKALLENQAKLVSLAENIAQLLGRIYNEAPGDITTATEKAVTPIEELFVHCETLDQGQKRLGRLLSLIEEEATKL